MTNGIQSRLHDAITVFARFLRQAGFTIGTGEIMMAIKACSMVETGNREDFRQAIKSSFITDHKTIPLFDQLFDLYWRNPDRLENVSDILRKLYESILDCKQFLSATGFLNIIKEIYQKRVEGIESNSQEEGESSEAFDVFLYSPEEVLRRKRFDAYTQEEIDEALKFIGDFDWGFVNRKIRRLKTGNRPYKLDIRQTIRNNIFPNQDFIDLKWKDRKHKPRPLVVLTDISGSMEQYTRILLHFIYSLYQVNHHVEAFTFGTRLSRITHYLKQKDVMLPKDGQSGPDFILSKNAKKLLLHQFELKNQEKMYTLYKWFDQASKNTKLDGVVICKRNGSDPLAIIDLDHFIDLIK